MKATVLAKVLREQNKWKPLETENDPKKLYDRFEQRMEKMRKKGAEAKYVV